MIRLARDETPCPSNGFNYQEGHYLGLVAKMECHPLHTYDHGRLARTETPLSSLRQCLLHFYISIFSYF